MSDKVKLAFVGTGDVFLKYYLPEAIEQEVFEISAICDVVRDRAERVAEFVGGAEVFDDYGKMLERGDVDLIAIVTPPTSHYALALAGLEAGKHVYVEKPFCRRLSEANHLVETARAKGVHLMAAPSILLDPPNVMMRDLIRDGAIGKVAFATSPAFQLGGAAPGYFDRFSRQLKFSNIEVLERPEEKTDASWYYQKGGGPVYDLAVYSITQITGLIGPVRRVTAFSGTVHPHRLLMGGTEEARQIDVTEDDNTSFLLDLGESRFVYVNAAWHGGGSRAQGFEIVGSEGTITTSGSGDLVTRTREATVPPVPEREAGVAGPAGGGGAVVDPHGDDPPGPLHPGGPRPGHHHRARPPRGRGDGEGLRGRRDGPDPGDHDHLLRPAP